MPNTETLIAKWETPRKKYWLELYRQDDVSPPTYSYKCDGGGGQFGQNHFANDTAAIAHIAAKNIFYYKLSGHKMRQVYGPVPPPIGATLAKLPNQSNATGENPEK